MLKIAWRGVRNNTGRYIATLVAIMTGVAFFAATGFLGDRITDAVEGDTRARFGQVDVAVAPESTDDTQYLQEALRVPGPVATQIVAVDGVDGFAFVLAGPIAVRDAQGEIVAEGATGRQWISDEVLNPLELAEGRGPAAANEIAMDRGLAEELAVSVGDEITVLSIAGENPSMIVGITQFGDSDSMDGPGGTVSVSTAVGADWLGGGDVAYDEVYVRGSGSQQDLADSIAPLLPAGLVADTGDDFLQSKIDEIGAFVRIIRTALQGFAALAMIVGGFVIYNTFNVLVAQRVKELAVMRAIGATPKQVRRALRFEGIVVGLLGSAAGVLLGVGFMFLLDFVLQRFGVNLPGKSLVIRPVSIIFPILLGTVITVISVMIPARRASRTEPIEALRDAAIESSPYSRKRLIFTVVAFVAALALFFAGTHAAHIGIATFLLFAATIAAGPVLAVLAAKVSKPVLSTLGIEGRLASDNSARNPQRTATTANALLIGVFLVTLVSVSGTTVKDYVLEALEGIESADFLLASDGGTLDQELISTISEVDGVEIVETFRREAVSVNGQPSLVATVDIETLIDITDITELEGSLADLVPGTIAVKRDQDIALGDTVTINDANGDALDLTAVAVLDYAIDVEAVGNLLHDSDFASLVGDTAPTVAFIDTKAGLRTESIDAIESETEARPDLTLTDGNALGKAIGSAFDFMINAVNGLLGMSVLVAVIGIVNTLTLSIFERRRELGLLRIVGMKDRSVQRMVRIESILISILGTVIGAVLGVFTGWALIQAISRLVDDVDLAMNWAVGRVLLVLVVGVLLGILAAWLPAKRSTRLDLLEAIQPS